MCEIKKILFPVDFSDTCLGAARYVEAFVGHFEAELMLLHVIDESSDEEQQWLSKVQLDAFLSNELKYFTTFRTMCSGDPATEIHEVVESWKPDLVMMPTHGLGSFRRFLLGSVTAKVLHDVDCPVWTGAHAETAPRLEDIHCRKILCALDLRERSEQVLSWGAELATSFGASLAVVHAMEPTDISICGWYLNLGDWFRRYAATRTRFCLEALVNRARVKCDVFVKPGGPVRVSAAVAREYKADLVVIGRYGCADVAGHLLETSYDIIRESPCPVISV